MKCPKCNYLSFDPEPRCRNCGYDLDVHDSDLTARHAAPSEAPLPDLALHERPALFTPAPLAIDLVESGAVAAGADEYDQRTAYEDEAEADEPAAAHVLNFVAPVSAASLSAVSSESPIDPVPGLTVDMPADEPVVPALAQAAVRESSSAVELFESESASESGFDENAPVDRPLAEPLISTPSVSAPRLSLVDDVLARPRFATAMEDSVRAVGEVEAGRKLAPFRSRHGTTADLPLFVRGIADRTDVEPIDAPELARDQASVPDEDDVDDLLLSVPPAGPPLAVRRTVVEPPSRGDRADRRLGPFEHDLLEDLKRVEEEDAIRDRPAARTAVSAIDEAAEPAEPSRRALAAGADALVLGGIAVFVVWATLRLCGVGLTELPAGAIVPLVVFIAALAIAYLLMFTAAGGQTIGKMWMGLRIVDDDGRAADVVTVRQAAWRAALTVVSVVGLGLGWLPALLGRGVTLHDWLAGTRVVRA